MKKSQIYGQVFTYILTIVLMSFILVYGYNTIVDFKDRIEKGACLKLKTDLKNEFESITSDYGTVKRKSFQLCGGYTDICFVENFENPVLQGKIDLIIKDSVLSGTGMNAFLMKDIAKESFYVGKISVEPDVLCIKAIGNTVNLRLEGKGNHVLLSQWS